MNLIVAYIYLTLAIVLEVGATFFLRLSDGFTKPLYSILSILCFVLSLGGSARALVVLSVTVVYAIWSSLGTVLTAVVGRLVFAEQFGYTKLIGLVFIVVGVVFMNIEFPTVTTESMADDTVLPINAT
ncbi:hypothetical protein P9112_014632 [Eukaryota sp. TZLM1-RC]